MRVMNQSGLHKLVNYIDTKKHTDYSKNYIVSELHY